MTLGAKINKIRLGAKMTQEQFADVFGVSQQSVQKWENGASVPDLEKLVKISKHFAISLDYLILDNDGRTVEEMRKSGTIKPSYENIHNWEFYSSNLATEYRQSIEEGLDIGLYSEVFASVSRLPKNEIKKKLGDVLFEVVRGADTVEGYKYNEPSDLQSIKSLRVPYSFEKKNGADTYSRVYGAWAGRVAGCMLGKSVEGIHTDELIPFLKETNNYPMHRYIRRSDLSEEIVSKYKFPLEARIYADEIDGMPTDDDTNYTVLYQDLIEERGMDFTSSDVAQIWIEKQGKNAYCTAERVAFCNFVNGYMPPDSAIYKNPFREWIGAQIRADYFGYINPANPELAAEMAFRDASVSHVKNGIYGEMFVAAMLAIAAVTDNIEDIIQGGLAEIPATSRLYEDVMSVYSGYKSGVEKEECFAEIHKKYDEHDSHGWCHTNSNAMIVAASLLYGEGDFAKSICMAVETGFDTDCNGATVGSILGMANGINGIPEYWTNPFGDKIYTSIFGHESVSITDRAALTIKHINGK